MPWWNSRTLHTTYGPGMPPDWPEAIKLVRYAAPVRAVEPGGVPGVRHYTVTAVGPVHGQRSVGIFAAASMMEALVEASMNCEPSGWRGGERDRGGCRCRRRRDDQRTRPSATAPKPS